MDQNSQPPMPATAPSTPPPPPPNVSTVVAPKRKVPKPLIFGGIAVLIILVLVLLVTKLFLPTLNQSREISLTWWGLWEDKAIIDPLIAEYQQTHPNVKIEYSSQSKQDYRERLTNALAQDNGPDIYRIHNSWVPMFANQLEPLPAEVMSPAEYQSTFFPVVTSDLTSRDGKIVGMPLGFDTIGLYINDEIFSTYGKSVPITWDEFRELARELTVKDEQGVIRQAGAAMGSPTNVDHWPEILATLMLQNKVNMSSPTGPRAEEALDYFTRFTRTDKVWDDTLPNSTIAFAAGKVAMYFGPSWRAHEIRQQNPSLKFRVFTVPQLRKATPTDPNVYYASYWIEGVSANSREKEEAWKFLKYVSEKESLEKLYTNASATRAFGEPYPRLDMQNVLAADPLVGAFVQQGREAKSWYLAARTFDGPTGINTQINKYFEDAVRAVNNGSPPQAVLSTVAQGVTQVLSRYGLVSAPAQPAQ